jgi:hypothetical protein
MADARMEAVVSQTLLGAHILERAIHDPHPWTAMVHGHTSEWVKVRRRVIPADLRVVFTTYLTRECREIESIDLYCGGVMIASRDVAGRPSAPCRVTLGIRLTADEVSV